MRKFNMGKIMELKVNGMVKVIKLVDTVTEKLKEDSGNFIEEMIKYIIGIVLGALILGGLYALIKNVVLPALTSKVTNLFDFTI